MTTSSASSPHKRLHPIPLELSVAGRRLRISTFWLYTRTAERIYAIAGWQTVEMFDDAAGLDILVGERRDTTTFAAQRAPAISPPKTPTKSPPYLFETA